MRFRLCSELKAFLLERKAFKNHTTTTTTTTTSSSSSSTTTTTTTTTAANSITNGNATNNTTGDTNTANGRGHGTILFVYNPFVVQHSCHFGS